MKQVVERIKVLKIDEVAKDFGKNDSCRRNRNSFISFEKWGILCD